MKLMIRFSTILFVVFFIVAAKPVNICFAQTKSAFANSDSTKTEAEQIWELAIKAKGGRERLLDVRSIIISISADSRFRGETIKSQTEHLVVIPNKEWIWDDNRPSVFGLRMTMYNWEAKNKYFTLPGDREYKGLMPIEASENSLFKMPWIVNILLETKWHRPMPEKVSEGKIGSQKVDVVQTRLDGERIDFALDKKTHLPVKFTRYTIDAKTGKEQPKYEGYLTNYVDVEGIKIPSGRGNESNTKTSYRFNVEYDEDIFKSPPPFEVGPEAWKKK